MEPHNLIHDVRGAFYAPMTISAGTKVEKAAYLITVTTSKKQYTTKEDFEKNLRGFLQSMKKEGLLIGLPEFHNSKGTNEKLHMHGFYFADDIVRLGPLSTQSKNKFKFHIVPCVNRDDFNRWLNYCIKEQPYTRDSLGYRPVCRFDNLDSE